MTVCIQLTWSNLLQVNVYTLGKTFLAITKELCLQIPAVGKSLSVLFHSHTHTHTHTTHMYAHSLLNKYLKRNKRCKISIACSIAACQTFTFCIYRNSHAFFCVDYPIVHQKRKKKKGKWWKYHKWVGWGVGLTQGTYITLFATYPVKHLVNQISCSSHIIHEHT